MTMLALPRYRVCSITGFPITAKTVDSRDLTPRNPVTTWQVEDSWDQWKVVLATRDEAEIRRYAAQLNLDHTIWMKRQKLIA